MELMSKRQPITVGLPLLLAGENGYEAVVKLPLTKDGVDPDSKDTKYGQTPLSWAAKKGHEAVVKLLAWSASVATGTSTCGSDVAGLIPWRWAFVSTNLPLMTFLKVKSRAWAWWTALVLLVAPFVVAIVAREVGEC